MTRLLTYPGHELFAKNIVRADNCDLFDAEGTRYVDLESGVWCTPLGHSHPRVVKALCEQAARIAHTGFNYTSQIVEDAATEVLSVLGMEDGRCTFLCSGSEAVEFGVRVARMVSTRPLFLTMADSYFGAYGAAHQRHDHEWFCFDWSSCAACPDSMCCDTQCKRWASMPFDRFAAFVFEPGSSSGNVRLPPRKLIASIAHALHDTGGLIMANEVTTGIGRTGRWFGYQHYEIKPDIVALGKGIGNGYPVSVCALTNRTLELLGDQPVPWAQSHQNDPLGAAVAREVVHTIQDEGLIERSKQVAEQLHAGLQAIKSRIGVINEIRARGLMLAIELKDDAKHSLTATTHRELARKGFLVARRPTASVLRLDPALTIPSRYIDDFLTALEEILRVEGVTCD
jgi:acetylornithine/N-succinyldiaminopimelate aminotransferase